MLSPFGLDWLPFLISPILGGLFVGYLTTNVSKETKGHGIPEVLESVALHGGRMPLRVPFIKIIASASTLGTGGSAGREGPIAQIGAGFASLIAEKLDLSARETKLLVVAGVAAGISATFNAPIGGALFSLEVILRNQGVEYLIPILLSSVIATVVGQILLGFNPAFLGFPELKYHDPSLIPLFIALGIICGLISAFWIFFFYAFEDVLENIFAKFKVHNILQPAIGGLFLGLILLMTYFLVGKNWEKFTVMGRSYLPMEQIFNGSFLAESNSYSLLLIIFVLIILKMLATGFTIGSGGSGGVFAPTLFIGAFIGAIFALFASIFLGFSTLDIALFSLLGMAGFFAGTGRAPLTAIIMTAEMTEDYFLSIPLMFVVSISWLVSTRFSRDDIYIKKLLKRGVDMSPVKMDILEEIQVKIAMTPRDELIIIDSKTRLESVMDLIAETKHEGFPVFNADEFVGIITLSDVQKGLKENLKHWVVQNVIENKTKPNKLICTHKDASLTHALMIMEKNDVSRLPVVEKGEKKFPKLIGWLTNHDITHAYVNQKAMNLLEQSEEDLLTFSDYKK